MASTHLSPGLSVLTHELCKTHLGVTYLRAQGTLHEVSGPDVTGAGRLAWGLPHFGPNLHQLLLTSNKHQNFWNMLMLVEIIVIYLQLNEIRRNVGCKNHRNRLPTPTKACGLLPIQRKGNDSKRPASHSAHSPAQIVRPVRTPSNPRSNLRLARGLPAEALGNTPHLCFARG